MVVGHRPPYGGSPRKLQDLPFLRYFILMKSFKDRGGARLRPEAQAYFDLALRPKVMEQCKLAFLNLVQAISMPANLGVIQRPGRHEGKKDCAPCAAVWDRSPGGRGLRRRNST